MKFFRQILILVLTATPSVQCWSQVYQSPCSLSSATHDVKYDAKALWTGIKHAPKAAIEPHNLAWELPIGAVTGVLIAEVDQPANDRIQSQSLQSTASRWSNIGLAMELGSGAAAWGIGCGKGNSKTAEAGFAALTALGAAGAVDLVLKLSFNRQFPYTPGSTGRFWGGGRSFPSGHSATSFAFASTIAHSYPHNRWIKWGAYAVATGVSLSRYPAKKHYWSDILAGATLGYVTGSYLADQTFKP